MAPPPRRRFPPLRTSVKILIAVVAVATAAVIVVIVAVSTGPEPSTRADDPRPGRAVVTKTPGPTSPTPPPTSKRTPTTTPPDNPAGELTAPERGRYCRAYAALPAQVLMDDDDDGGVDLAQLSRTFSALSTNYAAARDVAPVGLVSDYATVLGYLQTAQQAITSKDVDQIKIMVTNLGTLNDFMANIETTSKRLCR